MFRLVPIAALFALGACAYGPEDELGADSVAIVGGNATASYTAVPLLVVQFEDGQTSLCSGTLISPQVILTAAHCLEFDPAPTGIQVYFGADATVENDPNHLDTISAANWTYHPEWNISDLNNGHDVGLVALSRPAPVRPIGINRSTLDGREGDPVRLVGWGRTDGDSSDYGRKRQVMSSLSSQTNILMQYGSEDANTCQGDSGGPNFMDQDGTEVVAGITSFGNTGCDQYGVGTNVAAFAKPFIDPWAQANDSSGSCGEDQSCNSECGSADPDCKGSDTGQSASGAPLTGGCQAAATERYPFGPGLILVTALLCLRQRRREISH